ncbi:DUF3307 domain-containing protein [Dyadobacter luteus]|uniref:DUF3307 domain-containing protein n=1 Tax=Dyadobacter luteus TaxID=2259619 RepID=A0A3D8YDV8_9BACT|nr:DUF3307 domain-containing protein [Dyadobacter luteus]REA62710.1 DUF3307 domain-containing protein [Dyadobacter luteus]
MKEFLLLLLAHILSDFYWQPTKWVQDKRDRSFRSPYLYMHAGVVTISSYVFLGHWSNPLPALVVGVIHTIVDIAKIELDKKGSAVGFVVDQIAHILTIALVAVLLTSTFTVSSDLFGAWLYSPKVLAQLSGALLCLSPVSFLVGILTKPWRDELSILMPDANDNLANAGRWIGITERLLIFIFVIVGQFSAIGFLIAAKSLLRYNDKNASGDIPPAYISKKSEYVLVGTLMSYTCAIVIAMAAKMFYS